MDRTPRVLGSFIRPCDTLERMGDTSSARIVRMLDDPAVSGSLLLVGLAMAAQLDLRQKWIKPDEIARQAFGVDNNYAQRKLRMVLREDIRRYVIPTGERAEHRCQGPMPRAPFCRRSPTWRTTLGNWETGERSYLLACNKHADWFQAVSRENLAAKPEKVPLPPANTGGALRVHLPEINWPRVWRSVDSTWVEHPERTPWPKPTLQLVMGDGLGGGEAAALAPV